MCNLKGKIQKIINGSEGKKMYYSFKKAQMANNFEFLAYE